MVPETPGVKVLTETEIQSRLYGEYLGRRNRPGAPVLEKRSSPVSSAADPQWTGVEILKGEMESLRAQLIRLRRERETLEEELKVFKAPRKKEPSRRKGGWVASLALLGLLSYPLGQRFLQASPSSVEPSPYTLQVAVYRQREPSSLAVEYLQGLGYPAFLAESSRGLGRKQFRIYVGQFVTRAEAEGERQRLASDPRFSDFKDAFVRFQ
ncbi:MAG: SPOR domain-containing protein [Candidatus Omnitrophica bacterium]|nr:SPOR domain-containing protein [Candidatus Omnitrophota bacterium]